MSSEKLIRRHLGTAILTPVDITKPKPVEEPEEKGGILAPLQFWRNFKKNRATSPVVVAEPPVTNGLSFPPQELIVPQNNLRRMPVEVVMAKSVRKADKIQAKAALEALIEMNRNSTDQEQVSYNLVPFSLKKGHDYEIVEYDAEDVPMRNQNTNTPGELKESADGTVIAYQFVAQQEVLLESPEQTRLSLITNNDQNLVKIIHEAPRQKDAINIAVVIEEQGGGLLNAAETANNAIQQPNDFWGKTDQPEEIAPGNISYLADYKKDQPA